MELRINTGGASVLCLKISPSQDYFACGLEESPLKVYNILTGEEIIAFSDAHYDSVSALGWKEWGTECYVVAGYAQSGYLRIVNLQGENALKYTAKNSSDYGFPSAAQLHSKRVNSLEIIDNQVFTASEDKNLVRFSLEKKGEYFAYTRQQEKRARIGHLVKIWDQDRLLVLNSWQIIGEITYVVSLVQANTFKTLKKWSLFRQEVVDFAKLSDTTFVFAGNENKLWVWDWETNQIINECKTQKVPRHFRVLGEQIFHSEGQEIVVRNSKTLEKINVVNTFSKNISAMDISKDGRIIVAGDEDGDIFIHLTQ
jgi:WD40 repeat protein